MELSFISHAAASNSITVVMLFYLLCFFVGVFFYTGIKNFKDYSLGGKQFSMFMTGATTTATIIGAQYTFGFSEQLYEVGYIICLVFSGHLIKRYLTVYLFADRISALKNTYSLGNLMGSYYGKNAQIMTGVMSVLICAVCVAMQIAVFGFMGKIFFNIDESVSAALSAAIITLYCFLGGIRAVVMTDVIQIIIIVIIFPVICYIAVVNYGGLEKLTINVASTKLTAISDHPNLNHYLMVMLLFSIPEFDPAEFHRLLIAKNANHIKQTLKIATLISIIFFIIIVTMTSIAYVSNQDLPGSSALIYTIQRFIPQDLAIAGYIAIIAVVMSTTDSYLNTASVYFVNDIIKPLTKNFNNPIAQVQIARLSAFLIGGIACYLAISEDFISLMYKFMDLWFPTMLVPIYACMFNIKSSFKIVCKAMIVGLGVLFAWQYFDLEATTSVMPVIPSMLANIVTFIFLLRLNRAKLNEIFKKSKTRSTFYNFKF